MQQITPDKIILSELKVTDLCELLPYQMSLTLCAKLC